MVEFLKHIYLYYTMSTYVRVCKRKAVSTVEDFFCNQDTSDKPTCYRILEKAVKEGNKNLLIGVMFPKRYEPFFFALESKNQEEINAFYGFLCTVFIDGYKHRPRTKGIVNNLVSIIKEQAKQTRLYLRAMTLDILDTIGQKTLVHAANNLDWGAISTLVKAFELTKVNKRASINGELLNAAEVAIANGYHRLVAYFASRGMVQDQLQSLVSYAFTLNKRDRELYVLLRRL